MKKTKSIAILILLSLWLFPQVCCEPKPAPYEEKWEELNKDLVTFVTTMFTDWVKLKFTKDEQVEIITMAKEWRNMAEAQEKMKPYCGKTGFKVKFFGRTLFREALWTDRWQIVYENMCDKLVGDVRYFDGLLIIIRIGLKGETAKVSETGEIQLQTQPQTQE